jgi:hypothetical protein
VYWIYTLVVGPILTYAALLWWKKPSQISGNRKTAHLQLLACVSITGSMHSTPTAALEVILMLLPLGIYIEAGTKQATYRLNYSGELTRARFGHSEIFEKMTNEWSSLLPPGDKIVPIIALGRRFLVELPPRSSCLSLEAPEILPSDGVRFVHGWFTL